MNSENVALISLLITTGLSLIINTLNFIQNSKNHYSDTISKHSIEWIKETRIIVAEFLAFCETEESLNDTNRNKFNILKNKILINLNSDKEKYKNDDKIRNYLIDKSYDEIKESSSEIRDTFVELFKDEWDKAKEESGKNIVTLLKNIKQFNICI